MLYICTIANDKHSQYLLSKFNDYFQIGGEARMKKQQKAEKELLECNLADFQENPLVYAIIRLFQKYHSKSIFSPRKHQLDPSLASLFANISDLTQQYNISECEIYYDESKSIINWEEFLKKIGEKQKFISHRNDLKISIPKINHINMVKSETNMGVRIGDILLYVIAKEFLLNKKNLLDLEAISFNAILPESQEDIQIMIDKMHKYDIVNFLLSL